MKLRMNRKAVAIATSGLALTGLVLATAGTASADPVGSPTYRALAGVGSDTTFAAMNGLSDVITIGGVKQIASYNPLPASSLISPKAAANCQNLVRPNGSGAGRTALVNSLTPGNPIEGCYDFARSSSLSLGAVAPVTGGLTYVPFGIDAFTYATAAGSAVPSDLSVDDLKAIYRCEVPDIKPLLPQSGSGTRQYWLSTMGLTEGDLSTYTCVKDVKNGTPVQEHDGRVLTANDEIAPFSIASWVSQAAGSQVDVRGKAQLANTAGTSSLAAGSATELARSVYNVIPTNKIATAPWSTVFVGGSSLVCDAEETITKFGFAPTAACGSTTLQTP